MPMEIDADPSSDGTANQHQRRATVVLRTETVDGSDLDATVQDFRCRGFYVWTADDAAFRILAIHERVVPPGQPTRWPAVPRAADVERLPPMISGYLKSDRPGVRTGAWAREESVDGRVITARIDGMAVFSLDGKGLDASEQLPVTGALPSVASYVATSQRIRYLGVDEAAAIITRGRGVTVSGEV